MKISSVRTGVYVPYENVFGGQEASSLISFDFDKRYKGLISTELSMALLSNSISLTCSVSAEVDRLSSPMYMTGGSNPLEEYELLLEKQMLHTLEEQILETYRFCKDMATGIWSIKGFAQLPNVKKDYMSPNFTSPTETRIISMDVCAFFQKAEDLDKFKSKYVFINKLKS